HTRSKRDWSSDVCSSDLVFLFPLFISTLALTAFLTVAIFLDLPTKYRILAKQHLSGSEINCEQINCEQGTGTLFSFYKEHTDYRSEERRVGKACRCRL